MKILVLIMTLLPALSFAAEPTHKQVMVDEFMMTKLNNINKKVILNLNYPGMPSFLREREVNKWGSSCLKISLLRNISEESSWGDEHREKSKKIQELSKLLIVTEGGSALSQDSNAQLENQLQPSKLRLNNDLFYLIKTDMAYVTWINIQAIDQTKTVSQVLSELMGKEANNVVLEIHRSCSRLN